MTKHVFEITEHGSIYHRGEFVSETAHFVIAQKVGFGPRRMASGGKSVVEADDPQAVVDAWAKEWGTWTSDVKAAEGSLHAAKRFRLNACRAAIGLASV